MAPTGKHKQKTIPMVKRKALAIPEGIPGRKWRPQPEQDIYEMPTNEVQALLEELAVETEEDDLTSRSRGVGIGEEELSDDDPETDFGQYEEEFNPFYDEDEPNHLTGDGDFGIQDLPDDTRIDI